MPDHRTRAEAPTKASRRASKTTLRDSLCLGVLTASILFLVIGLAGLDGHLAGAPTSTGGLGNFVSALDLAFGKQVSNFLLGPLIALGGIAFNLTRKRRILSGQIPVLGLIQLLTTCAADFSKPLFQRMRPFQAFEEGVWDDRWFAGVSFGSFPSGHAAFYAGLFVPLALIHRRHALALLAVPVLVSLERIMSRDHYVSDVASSWLIAGALSALLIRRRADH